jgi:hypothetical protein
LLEKETTRRKAAPPCLLLVERRVGSVAERLPAGLHLCVSLSNACKLLDDSSVRSLELEEERSVSIIVVTSSVGRP